MRKIVSISILLAAFMVVSLTNLARAGYDSDVGYVIVRCTVTIDVDVLDTWATAWFVATSTQSCTLSPNQEDVSVSSIVVKNQSVGAVLKYAVVVDTIQRTTDGTTWVADADDIANGIKGWTLSNDGTNDDVGEFVLAAVFAKSRPAILDFGTNPYNDQLRSVVTSYDATALTNHTYKVDTNFAPEDPNKRYPSALGNTTGVNAISPKVDADNPRGLWFYIKTPQAVTDEYPRRIIIRVYGTTVSSSW
jgi:hypothetical protein